MAVVFADPGGEYYFSTGINTPGIWTGGTAGATITNSAAAGRATSYAISNNLNTGWTLTRDLGASYQGLIAGAAHYIIGTYNNNAQLVRFFDGGTNQCDLRINTSGNLFFTRNGTQVGGTSTNFIGVGTGWVYIECKAFIASGTSGSMEVKVNGVVWLTVSASNFQNTGNASANQVQFNSSGSSGTGWNVKDIYILNTGAGSNTNYLGDVTVAVEYPNAAGTNNAWTPSSGTAPNEYQMVQDGITHTGSWPDGDSTYISSNTPGQIADFAHQSLVLTGTLYSVVHTGYMRKDDAGPRQAALVCLSGGTTEVGSSIALSNSYLYYQDVLDQDPNTNASWTVTNYNSATFGIKEIS